MDAAPSFLRRWYVVDLRYIGRRSNGYFSIGLGAAVGFLDSTGGFLRLGRMIAVWQRTYYVGRRFGRDWVSQEFRPDYLGARNILKSVYQVASHLVL